MFSRLKRALVESYVGAVALGYLLAQIVLQFVGIFVSPFSSWLTRVDMNAMMPNTYAPAIFSFRDASAYGVRFAMLLVIWLILVRWLYYSPKPKSE